MSTTQLERRAAAWPLAVWAGLVVLALGGLAAAIAEYTRGMADLAINQQVVWGLYIAAFFAAAGIGAGALVLVASHALRSWLTPGQQVRLLAAAVASFAVAGALIIMDVGSPLGVWRIAVSGQWTSLAVWDFYLLLAGLIVAVVAGLSVRSDGHDPLRAGVLAALMGLIGVSLLMAESAMLLTQAARPYWASGLTVLSFLAGGAVGGFGLGALLLDGSAREPAHRGLILSLVASVLIVLAEVLAGVLSGAPRAGDAARLLATSPFFWAYLIVGIALPLFLLFRKPVTPLALALGAGLGLLGVVLEKTQMLIVGQSQPWLPSPVSSYLPSWVEVVGVVGLAAAGVVAYGLLARLRRPEA